MKRVFSMLLILCLIATVFYTPVVKASDDYEDSNDSLYIYDPYKDDDFAIKTYVKDDEIEIDLTGLRYSHEYSDSMKGHYMVVNVYNSDALNEDYMNNNFVVQDKHKINFKIDKTRIFDFDITIMDYSIVTDHDGNRFLDTVSNEIQIRNNFRFDRDLYGDDPAFFYETIPDIYFDGELTSPVSWGFSNMPEPTMSDVEQFSNTTDTPQEYEVYVTDVSIENLTVDEKSSTSVVFKPFIYAAPQDAYINYIICDANTNKQIFEDTVKRLSEVSVPQEICNQISGYYYLKARVRREDSRHNYRYCDWCDPVYFVTTNVPNEKLRNKSYKTSKGSYVQYKFKSIPNTYTEIYRSYKDDKHFKKVATVKDSKKYKIDINIKKYKTVYIKAVTKVEKNGEVIESAGKTWKYTKSKKK